jgi:hypothetical protein
MPTLDVMRRPPFTGVPHLWERDGSLRDAYVLGTSSADWDAFLSLALEQGGKYSFDGDEKALPTVDDLFRNREGSHLLAIPIGPVQMNCHFFVPDEIELDIDPREVANEASHFAVLGFLERISLRVGKPLLLTPENTEECPYASFDPGTGTWMTHDQRGCA